jgi:hypothetical protein
MIPIPQDARRASGIVLSCCGHRVSRVTAGGPPGGTRTTPRTMASLTISSSLRRYRDRPVRRTGHHSFGREWYEFSQFSGLSVGEWRRSPYHDRPRPNILD